MKSADVVADYGRCAEGVAPALDLVLWTRREGLKTVWYAPYRSSRLNRVLCNETNTLATSKADPVPNARRVTSARALTPLESAAGLVNVPCFRLHFKVAW